MSVDLAVFLISRMVSVLDIQKKTIRSCILFLPVHQQVHFRPSSGNSKPRICWKTQACSHCCRWDGLGWGGNSKEPGDYSFLLLDKIQLDNHSAACIQHTNHVGTTWVDNVCHIGFLSYSNNMQWVFEGGVCNRWIEISNTYQSRAIGSGLGGFSH